MKPHIEQSSGEANHDPVILQHAAAFWWWCESILGQPGETHAGAVLDGLCAEYHDVLGREPIDINRVGSLTAEAALWLTGKRTF